MVGEYVGQLAADAAQAVRRAGLKPGLDRSFEYEPELLGLVVAQDPVAGSDLARNAMVTLYVAATGAATVDENAEATGDRDRYPEPIPVSPLRAAEHESEVLQQSRVRRRRKPGLAARAPQGFDRPPGPIPADQGLAGEAQSELVQVPQEHEWISEAEADTPALPDREEEEQNFLNEHLDEVSREEFVVHADDVFAGRANTGLPAWRKTYPRRRKTHAAGGFLSAHPGLMEYPWLARAAGGMLVAWALVAVAVALLGHSGGARQARPVAGVLLHASAVGVHRSVRPRLPRVKTTRPAHRHPQVRIRPRPREVPVSAAPQAPAGRSVTRPVAAATVPARVVDRAAAAPVAGAREFGPERQRGGPFSP
jgi:hypothetical protein